jgi:hypothetical protein
MSESDRKLNVPKPKRARNVTGFGTPPNEPQPANRGTAEETPPDSPTPSRSKKPRTRSAQSQRRSATSAPVGDDTMVRVHATVSPVVAEALRRRVETSGESHTEVLADAFLTFGHTLTANDAADRARYEQVGFRPKQPKRAPGRMTATFYVSGKARRHLDEAAARGGFASRSAFIDELLRSELQVGEGSA